jgi:ATP-dependent DNA helicase RecQ
MGLQETSITYNDNLYRYFYLCHYLPRTAGVDSLSRSLVKFKRGIRPDLDAWIQCSLELLRNIPLSPGTIIIRALRHDETQVHETQVHETQQVQETPPASLDLLGHALAAAFHCQFLPSLLRKSRPTLSNKGLTRLQRETELKDVYSIAPEALASSSPPSAPLPSSLLPFSAPSNPPFLLIDDILTTGTTIRTIIHTLHHSFPLSPLQIFTLAKVDYDADINRSSPPQSQNYHLEEGTGWIVAEEPATYNPLHDLKNSIRSNFK